MAMFGDMLERDRKRWGLTITYDRICKLFGWPQTPTWVQASAPV